MGTDEYYQRYKTRETSLNPMAALFVNKFLEREPKASETYTRLKIKSGNKARAVKKYFG